jgi:flagellar motor switch/type III secretory pathway protein FliN
VRARAVASLLTGLVGHETAIVTRRIEPIATSRLELGARGPLFLLSSGSSSPRAVAIEVEAELATALASALAGGSLPKIARARSVDPEVAGAVAGIAQWLARELGEEEIAIAAIDPPRTVLAGFLGYEALAIDLVVRIGALRTSVRLAVAVPELDASPAITPAALVNALGPTPIAAPLVIAEGRATRRALEGLALGDVLIVDRLVGGLAAIAAPHRVAGIGAREIESVAAGRRFRIEGSRVDLAAPSTLADNVRSMTDEAPASTVQIEAIDPSIRPDADLADLPLVVRIELGEIALPAREWALLAPGDVLLLDQRVGDPVTLRIAGRPIARGELVEVDGALGVRLQERAS